MNKRNTLRLQFISFCFIFFSIVNSYAFQSQSVVVDCSVGPVSESFCYDNNANLEYVYTSTGGESLNLTITSGFLETCCDDFIVLDSDGTELFNGGGDISGLFFQSSGDQITIQVQSDISVNCNSNVYDPIEYDVVCATCTNPTANYNVVDNCINGPQFFVDVDLTSLGDAVDVEISDNQGNSQLVNTTGVYTFGPYPNGTLVDITVASQQDVNCSISSGELTQLQCNTTFIDCSAGPLNENFCYSENFATTEFTYQSLDGSNLNLNINEGQVENNYDELIILDTDGSELYNGYGAAGDVTGLSFQSSGDAITIQVVSDVSVNCQSSGYTPIDYTVACATCVNPAATYSVVSDCVNGPQFFIDVDVTDLGSATDLDIADNQGNTQTVSAVGVYNFGPYPNGTIVDFTIENNQDSNCLISTSGLTQEFCLDNYVECGTPVNTSFCYENSTPLTFVYTSSDGSPLNLELNSGFVQNNVDEFIVYDTDGAELYNGYGNAGDLTGLEFQSTGDEISVMIDPSAFTSCSSSGYDPIDLTVFCATCINPSANFEVVEDCLNGPQFLVDVDITDLGSATDLDITDNQGNTQTASATGVYTFGPYPNGTLVDFTVVNNQDATCDISVLGLTQAECINNYVDCAVGPVNTNFCYDSGETTEFVYTSTDGTNLNLVINSGQVENNFDEFIVLDSDGTELYNGYGASGDISGLSFQSSGDEITIQIQADGSVSCVSSSNISEIDLTVSCATCINPSVNFEVVEDCLNGPQFFVDVDVTDLGSATDLDIADNQGNIQSTSSAGVYTFGPYPNGTLVDFTVENNQDSNCTVTASGLTQDVCLNNYVDCAVGPVNTNFCYDSGETTEFIYTSTDGTNLNLVINTGQVENNYDEFIVLDSDGTELYNGYGASGDISGLSFQSSGDEITIQIQADGSVSCVSSSNISEIDLTVSCATCTNPDVDFEVVSNCDTGNEEFFIEADVLDLGSATSLTLTDNQASAPQTVSQTGVVTFGPYSNNTGVVISVENDDDINCLVSSQSLTQIACPPDNDLCVDAFPAVVNSEQFCADTTPVTITAANASSVPVSCGGPVVQDVWYEFTASSSAHMVTLINPPGSVSHAVYEGDCNNLTELYCSEEFDNAGNSDGIVATNLTIGNTYYVRVFSDSQISATFDLCITTPDYENDNVTCEDVVPFCAPFDSAGNPEPLVFANGYYYLQEFTAEDGPDYGCLGSEPNPAWFYLQVDQTGDLEFEIVQNTAFDGNGNPVGEQLDVDFIVYGPFSQLDDNCDDLTAANTVDCSYSISAVEDMVLPGATAGDIYLVLITNYNQSPGYISLVQTNYGVAGGGTTDCTILDETVYGCEGDSVDLVSEYQNGLAYVWYLFNESTQEFEFISEGNENDPSTLTVSEEGIYQLETFDQAGIPLPKEEFTVVFSPSPVVDLGPDDSLCDVTDLTLDATPANASEFGPDVEYIWYLDGVEIAGETNATITITDEGVYSVEVIGTVLDDSGNPVADSTCAGTDEVVISNADFTVSLGDDQVLCDEDSFTLEAIVTGEDATNATYTWFDSGNNVIPGETGSTLEVTAEGTYYVEVSIEGCESVDGVEILFPDSPEVDLGADAIVCSGATYSLDATPSNASDFDALTYSWLDADGVEISTDAMPSLPGGTYMVTVTGEFTNNGMPYTCEGTDQIIIEDVTYNIDLGGDQELCGIDPYTITATITDEDTTNATYQWSDSSGPIPGETGSSYTATTDGTYTVEVTIDGCADTASVDLLFDLSPQIDLGTDVTTCDLAPYTIDATPINMPASDVIYTWSLDGTELAAETGATLDPSAYGFGTYTVTAVSVNDSDGSCEVSVSVVYTETAIDLTITATEGETAITIPYCSDSEPVPSHTITFTASADGAPAGVSYQWYLDGNLINGATNSTYTVTYEDEGVFIEDYSVEISYDNCLFTSAVTPVEVTIEPYENGCVISQGISPGNVDGLNDCLDLTFLDDRTGIESLKVYNRYGRLVFEQNNYIDSFCGQDINGDDLPSGTYYYVLVLEGDDPVFGRMKKSWVYINREAN